MLENVFSNLESGCSCMKCAECNYSWKDEGNVIATCHADPNFPAPCEEEEEDEIIDCYTMEDLGNNWW